MQQGGMVELESLDYLIFYEFSVEEGSEYDPEKYELRATNTRGQIPEHHDQKQLQKPLTLANGTVRLLSPVYSFLLKKIQQVGQ
jgi:hypothetical protein